MLVKGIKSNFFQIQTWLQDTYNNLKRLIMFIEADESNMMILLSSLKPGLLSRDEEVSLWTLKILQKLSYELNNMGLLSRAYEWFCRENGALYACFVCIRQHPYLKETVVMFMLQMAKNNIIDVLTVQIRKIFDNAGDYLDSIHTILEPLQQTNQCNEEVHPAPAHCFARPLPLMRLWLLVGSLQWGRTSRGCSYCSLA